MFSQLTEDLNKAKAQVQSLTEQLNRATTMGKSQISILRAAQQREVRYIDMISVMIVPIVIGVLSFLSCHSRVCLCSLR